MSEKVQNYGSETIDAKVNEYISELEELRRDGTEKVRTLTQEIRRIKIRKNLTNEEKGSKISGLLMEIGNCQGCCQKRTRRR